MRNIKFVWKFPLLILALTCGMNGHAQVLDSTLIFGRILDREDHLTLTLYANGTFLFDWWNHERGFVSDTGTFEKRGLILHLNSNKETCKPGYDKNGDLGPVCARIFDNRKMKLGKKKSVICWGYWLKFRPRKSCYYRMSPQN
ncbi:MAG: hypothetical protein H6581_00435 [Bacteroidia bacterium]|nr:hypothetical protein [Bacteroidia bacterium]